MYGGIGQRAVPKRHFAGSGVAVGAGQGRAASVATKVGVGGAAAADGTAGACPPPDPQAADWARSTSARTAIRGLLLPNRRLLLSRPL